VKRAGLSVGFRLVVCWRSILGFSWASTNPRPPQGGGDGSEERASEGKGANVRRMSVAGCRLQDVVRSRPPTPPRGAALSFRYHANGGRSVGKRSAVGWRSVCWRRSVGLQTLGGLLAVGLQTLGGLLAVGLLAGLKLAGGRMAGAGRQSGGGGALVRVCKPSGGRMAGATSQNCHLSFYRLPKIVTVTSQSCHLSSKLLPKVVTDTSQSCHLSTLLYGCKYLIFK
jgi:hypothetical protein